MKIAGIILICLGITGLVYVGIRLVAMGLKIYRSQYLAHTARELDETYSQFRAEQYLYFSLIAGAVLGVAGFLLTFNIVPSALLSIAGLAGPQVLLKMQKAKRKKMFDQQVVDVLMLISNLLKAGTSIRNSLKVIVEEMPAPTRQEYAIVDREISLGTPFNEAFGRMCVKSGNPDMMIVSNALAIAAKTGGDLAEMFENIAKTIRDRREAQDKIDALTSQGKMQGWIVGLMPVVLVTALSFVSPELTYPLFHTFIGWCLLALVVVLEILGIIFVRKVITIDI